MMGLEKFINVGWLQRTRKSQAGHYELTLGRWKELSRAMEMPRGVYSKIEYGNTIHV